MGQSLKGGIKGTGKVYTEFQLPDLPSSLSKTELIEAQREEPNLKVLFSEVKSRDEMESLASELIEAQREELNLEVLFREVESRDEMESLASELI